ncbi:hypothetical protein GCM10020366_60010 [Saccharopolyspora gregorii]|uniref:Uncharacterized protein n=1 Tax=Saccharopolyspora gregorii TaxID=33914 RepID=A0ABP6RZP8_9PSEU
MDNRAEAGRNERFESPDPDAAIATNALRWNSRDGRSGAASSWPSRGTGSAAPRGRCRPPGAHPGRRNGTPAPDSPAPTALPELAAPTAPAAFSPAPGFGRNRKDIDEDPRGT